MFMTIIYKLLIAFLSLQSNWMGWFSGKMDSMSHRADNVNIKNYLLAVIDILKGKFD